MILGDNQFSKPAAAGGRCQGPLQLPSEPSPRDNQEDKGARGQHGRLQTCSRGRLTKMEDSSDSDGYFR